MYILHQTIKKITIKIITYVQYNNQMSSSSLPPPLPALFSGLCVFELYLVAKSSCNSYKACCIS